MGTTVNQKRLFFNLSKEKQRLLALREGDLRPDEVTLLAKGLGVTEQDVIEMNRRLSGDLSLNAPLNVDGDSAEWQDRLVDEGSDQESRLAERDESENRRKALGLALTVLDNRERRIFGARRLIDPPLSLAQLAFEFRISRERVRQIERSPLKRCKRRCILRWDGMLNYPGAALRLPVYERRPGFFLPSPSCLSRPPQSHTMNLRSRVRWRVPERDSAASPHAQRPSFSLRHLSTMLSIERSIVRTQSSSERSWLCLSLFLAIAVSAGALLATAGRRPAQVPGRVRGSRATHTRRTNDAIKRRRLL
jgi:hypothetical protein